jgi:glycosyltransferase involved in cell wall biosynthesis
MKVDPQTERSPILVLIPAYNEGAHIGAVVESALAHLPVLVVDDGSSDDSALKAKNAGALVVVQHPNQGKGAALLAGLQRALGEEFQAVITLDADGQHDPSEIPSFIHAYEQSKADLIIGQRDFSHMPLVRRLSNTIGTWIFSLASGRSVPDNQSGYRLLSRRMIAALVENGGLERGFEFEIEMIVTCILKGYTLDWVPIRTIYAGEKSHIRPFKHLVKFLQVSWRTFRMISKGDKPG